MFDGFGEVRGALHGTPSPERWWELCGALDRLSGAHLAARVLPYVSESLARWPDDLRVAPDNWIDRLVYAGRCDLVTLTRRLSFADRRLDPEMLTLLLDSPSARALRFVELGANASEPEVLERVVASAAVRAGSLRGLGFARARLRQDAFAVLLDAEVEWEELSFRSMPMARRVVELVDRGAPRLARLSVSDCDLDEYAAMALANMADLGGLRALDLSWNPDAGFARRFVATAPSLGRFDALTSLDLTGCRLDMSDTRALLALVERLPLERIALDHISGMDAFVRRLASSPALARLTHVGVYGALSDPGSLGWLIEAPEASEALRASELGQLHRMVTEPAKPDGWGEQQELLPF
jgi:hypothetical protein